jgi:hypothetical protein
MFVYRGIHGRYSPIMAKNLVYTTDNQSAARSYSDGTILQYEVDPDLFFDLDDITSNENWEKAENMLDDVENNRSFHQWLLENGYDGFKNEESNAGHTYTQYVLVNTIEPKQIAKMPAYFDKKGNLQWPKN